MGALHEGHLSLVRRAQQESQVTVCSIFVNPTQFNDQSDLERYPRTPERDLKMLEKTGLEAVFMPEVDEIYPKNAEKAPDLGQITRILEGEHRPGHFDGVAQVVRRFFEVITPDKAFFGSKDYQQILVIKALVKKLNLPTEIIACPILREPDGLAMSSRNTLFNPEERKKASLVPAVLNEAVKIAGSDGIAAASRFVSDSFQKEAAFRLEYFEIRDPHSLAPFKDDKPPDGAVALLAVWLNKVRLIDNMLVGEV